MKPTHKLINNSSRHTGETIKAGTEITVEEFTNCMYKCISPKFGIFYAMKRDVAEIPTAGKR